MTYIRINITINERKIREQAIKLYNKIEKHIKQNYRETFIRASEIGLRHSQTPIVAKLYKLLGHEKSDLSGTIMCPCRRRTCPGYILPTNTFIRKIGSC